MEESLISFETAVLAKEKGFELNSICYYELIKEGQLRYKLVTEEDESGTWVNDDYRNRIACVTQSLLQKWLREVHNIHICFKYIEEEVNKFHFVVYDGRIKEYGLPEIYPKYDKGLEEKLKEALKLITK
jgi:hypothetical protein